MIDWPPDVPKPSYERILDASRELCGGDALHLQVAIKLAVEIYRPLTPQQVCEAIAGEHYSATPAKTLRARYRECKRRRPQLVRVAAMHVLAGLIREAKGYLDPPTTEPTA